MILRMRAYRALLDMGDGTVHCDALTTIIPADNLMLKIEHRGNELYSGLVSSISVNNGYFIDNDGVAIPFTLSTETQGNTSIPNLSIEFRNMWNYIDLDITFSTTLDNSTFTNTFRIYGYDLGVNDDISKSQYNDKFDIILNNCHTLPYFITYRKPFTNKVHLYNACSYIDSSSYLYSDYTLISTLNNTFICFDGNTTIYRKSSTDCLQSRVVNDFQWMPDWELVKTCTNCTDIPDCECACESIYDEQGVTTEIDFTVVGVTYTSGFIGGIPCDDGRIYTFKSLGIRYNIYDMNAIVDPTLEQLSVFNIGNIQYNSAGYISEDYAYSINIPSTGAYQVRVCLEVLGIPEYIISGDVDAGEYYQIQCSLTANYDASSFELISSFAVDILQTVILSDVQEITPVWDVYGNLTQVCTANSDLSAGVYYMITQLGSGDFTSVLTPSVTPAVGYCFIVDGTTPIYPTWCDGVPSEGTYDCGVVTKVTPVIICCKTILLEACYPYTVTKTECNEITICNYNSEPRDVLHYTITVFDGTSFVATDYTNVLLEEVEIKGCDVISNLVDGVYNVALTLLHTPDEGEQVTTVTNTLIIIDCGITACKLAFLKKAICCNPETNCDSCEDDDCNKKDYYNFNSFSIILQTYLTVVNHLQSFGYYYVIDEDNTVEILQNVSAVYNMIEQANRYCLECEEPCKDC